MAAIVFTQEITNAGGTFTYDPQSWGGGNAIVFLYTSAPITLAANVNIALSSDLNIGSTLSIIQSASDITRNGKRLNIIPPSGGYDYTDDWQFLTSSMAIVQRIDTSDYVTNVIWDLVLGNGVSAATALSDSSVTLAKIEDLASAQIIIGNASNRPAATAVTGDIAITNGGVTSISAGVIVNADVNASAAIARSKMASGTASHVVINDGSGVLSSEAQLAASRGGTALDTSASTGFATVSAGTWTVGSISDVITLDVSFESGEVGDFKVKLPYACTVAEIYAYAYKVIAGTDAGTIVPKDNGGTTMTGGTITFAASDPRGTAYTSTPSANNTFTAGQLLTLTTAKTTAGGKVLVSVKVTRNL